MKLPERITKPMAPLILITVTLMVTLVVSMPSLADGRHEGKHKHHSPPGWHKKAHGHGMPPGWQKRLVKGRRLDADIYRHSYVVVHERDIPRYRDRDRVIVIHDHDDRRYYDDRYSRRDGLITVQIDDRLIRMVEATHEIVDILN